MKTLRAFMLCTCFVLLGCGVASAQEKEEIKAGTAPPDLQIVKVSQTRGEDTSTSSASGGERGPRPLGRRGGGGRGGMHDHHRFPRPVHEVSLKLRNEGTREVKAVAWTYFLADEDADKPMVQYPFSRNRVICETDPEFANGAADAKVA